MKTEYLMPLAVVLFFAFDFIRDWRRNSSLKMKLLSVYDAVILSCLIIGLIYTDPTEFVLDGPSLLYISVFAVLSTPRLIHNIKNLDRTEKFWWKKPLTNFIAVIVSLLYLFIVFS